MPFRRITNCSFENTPKSVTLAATVTGAAVKTGTFALHAVVIAASVASLPSLTPPSPSPSPGGRTCNGKNTSQPLSTSNAIAHLIASTVSLDPPSHNQGEDQARDGH